MKSIKEKAEGHLNSVYAGYDDVLKELVKESYVSGANYVLEEIETIIKADLGSYKSQLDRIKNVIEQLKK